MSGEATSTLSVRKQETPYSVFLTIRKLWKKHHQVQQPGDEHIQQAQQTPVSVSQAENDLKDQEIKRLKCQLEDLKAKLQTSKHLENELQAQIDAAAVKAGRQKKKQKK